MDVVFPMIYSNVYFTVSARELKSTVSIETRFYKFYGSVVWNWTVKFAIISWNFWKALIRNWNSKYL